MTTPDPAALHADQAQDCMHAAAENHGTAMAIVHGIAALVHALLSIREELRTANQIATYDDGFGGRSVAPQVTAGMYDARARTQQQVRESFKQDQRERIARRTGQV